jgi:hypothetical protein
LCLAADGDKLIIHPTFVGALMLTSQQCHVLEYDLLHLVDSMKRSINLDDPLHLRDKFLVKQAQRELSQFIGQPDYRAFVSKWSGLVVIRKQSLNEPLLQNGVCICLGTDKRSGLTSEVKISFHLDSFKIRREFGFKLDVLALSKVYGKNATQLAYLRPAIYAAIFTQLDQITQQKNFSKRQFLIDALNKQWADQLTLTLKHQKHDYLLSVQDDLGLFRVQQHENVFQLEQTQDQIIDSEALQLMEHELDQEFEDDMKSSDDQVIGYSASPKNSCCVAIFFRATTKIKLGLLVKIQRSYKKLIFFQNINRIR